MKNFKLLIVFVVTSLLFMTVFLGRGALAPIKSIDNKLSMTHGPVQSESIPEENPVNFKGHNVYVEWTSASDPSSKLTWGMPWGTKDYHEDWCFYQELNQDGVREANRLDQEFGAARGHKEYALLSVDQIDVLPSGYETYAPEVLRELGESGDLRALVYLAEHAEVSEADKQWAIYESYVLGGTTLLSQDIIKKSGDAVRSIVREKDAETVATAKALLVTAVARGRFAGLRGDYMGLRSGFYASQLENVPEDLKQLLELTPEEIAHTERLGKAFLEEINLERQRRGMDNLRNEIPKIEHAVYQDMNAKLVASGEDFGWASDLLAPKTACFERMVAYYSKTQ